MLYNVIIILLNLVVNSVGIVNKSNGYAGVELIAIHTKLLATL